MKKYVDRQEAGIILAQLLESYTNRSDVLVLGLARGGVPVAYEIAKALHVLLDVFIVRKLGVPGQEELAMGALARGGITIFNEDIIHHLNISPTAINQVIQAEQAELTRREHSYRDDKPYPDIKGKTIILVDDGIATGATMRVAIKALQQLKPVHIVIAVPVGEKTTCKNIATMVDQFICPLQPSAFYAVGAWYENFAQTTDAEVRYLLKNASGFSPLLS